MSHPLGVSVLFDDPKPDPVDSSASRPPLAERMRPGEFDAMVGQRALLGPGGVIPKLLTEGRPPSLILWGPPGCGKTTVARIIGNTLDLPTRAISAVTSGVKDIKEIVADARKRIDAGGAPTLLFVDEIHRFNKAQQDSFLGPVEDGALVLVGATTENPSFELNRAVLSRCRVVPLEPLDRDDLRDLLARALTDRERGLGERELTLAPDLAELLLDVAEGDARSLLTDLEWIAAGTSEDGVTIESAAARELLSRLPHYDKSGEEHFNLISAFQKSIRGSDVDAGLYWLARMLEGGEDPLYVARRLVRIASEDVGVADPQALPLAMAARDAVQFLGLPEGSLALAEAVIYLATAPKSDRVEQAYLAALDEVRRSGSLAVPLEIRNAPTSTMRKLGYGKGYVSPHADDAGLAVPYLPEELEGRRFYEPKSIGFEREIAKRIEYYEGLRKRQRPRG
ncbi:MAG: replication-associated recombination protein A [Planctomycetota bacterium]